MLEICIKLKSVTTSVCEPKFLQYWRTKEEIQKKKKKEIKVTEAEVKL